MKNTLKENWKTVLLIGLFASLSLTFLIGAGGCMTMYDGVTGAARGIASGVVKDIDGVEKHIAKKQEIRYE